MYIARVLSCSSVLRSTFRQSGMLQFDMVQKQCCVLCCAGGEGGGYLDPIKYPSMSLYAQDGYFISFKQIYDFLKELGVSPKWNYFNVGISTDFFNK